MIKIQTTTTTMLLLILCSILSSFTHGHGNDVMSKHFVLARHLAGVTNVVLAADATTTEGPFFEVEGDYINTTDLTAAAHAGSPGISTDRTTVVNGIPITLNLGFYNVTNATGVTGPLAGAEVFIWHADATGVYSSVDSQMQTEVTTSQYWLRATQTTDANGAVVFKSILPGWYGGRAVHWHLRVKLPGATSYVATTQMFLSDAFVTRYSTVSPYTQDVNSVTTLAADNVYTTVDSAVASELVLQPVGSNAAGYTSSLNFGIDISVNTTSSTSSSPGGPSPPNGTNPFPMNGTNPFPFNGTIPPPNGTNPFLSNAPTATPVVNPTMAPVAPTIAPIAPTLTPTTLQPITTPTAAPKMVVTTSKPVISSFNAGKHHHGSAAPVKNSGPPVTKASGKNKGKFIHRFVRSQPMGYSPAHARF